MPTLPRQQEESAGEAKNILSTCSPAESKVLTITLSEPSAAFPRQANICNQDPRPVDQARSHSPRPRISHKSFSSGNPITTLDGEGHMIDLVKAQLPDMQLSEDDKRKNLELLQEAKQVSERFHTRRGRRSNGSISDSPTGVSPGPTPQSSPVPSRSSSLATPPLVAADMPEVNYVSPPISQGSRTLVELRPDKHRMPPGLSPQALSPLGNRVAPGPNIAQHQCGEQGRSSPMGAGPGGATLGGSGQASPKRAPESRPPGPELPWALPRSTAQRVACTAEIKTVEAFPPLMRATTWDDTGISPEDEESLPSSSEILQCQDIPAESTKLEKLAKLREEHKLLRSQSIVGSKLSELSEITEQEKGPTFPLENEPSGRPEPMPNISDVMLQKLKLHRAQMGSSPPLTEKEVENAFVQLSLAFRNDNYTLETRVRQAERERDLMEENTEKELEDFKKSLKRTSTLSQNPQHQQCYQHLLEAIVVLHRLAMRVSSSAEMVGAVRQEKRMNKATEVMMQYVENLKRIYEKDHAELMEFKKLANQNPSRGYGASVDADDGVPRTSRSMSLTMGKALPRRRVSVAVVPKFNLINFPGQNAVTTRPILPVLCEATNVKVCPPVEPRPQATPAVRENITVEQERETAALTKPPSPPDETCSEVKAKIEEMAYNKGYLEGLRRSKELQGLKEEEEEEEEEAEKNLQKELVKEEIDVEHSTSSSGGGSGLLHSLGRLYPKVLRRNRLLWITLTAFIVTLLAVSLFIYFTDGQNASGYMS